MTKGQANPPIVLPTPVPVAVGEGKLVLAAKILSWIAVIMLLLAMSIALISAAEERSEIKENVSRQTEELICRTKATDDLLQVIALRDTLLTSMIAAISAGDVDTAQELLDDLISYNSTVSKAVTEHELALIDCASE